MKIEKMELSQLKVNEANPRTITKRKLDLLVERLLVFPKMINIRPIVIDNKCGALGGNMRLRAFYEISGMSIEHIREIVESTKNWAQWTEAEREQVLQAWKEWLQNPTVEVISADNLSAAEKKEFIIADNASFGEWDYDKLANEWDSDDLISWGVDVWNEEPVAESESEKKEQKDLSDQIVNAFKIEITLNDEEQQQALYDELTERGYICRILTL